MGKDRKVLKDSDWIAPTGSTVSSPREAKILNSYKGGMSISSLVVRYNVAPEAALRVLGLERQAIVTAEWYRAENAYAESRNVVRNAIRGDQTTASNRADILSNPFRGTRS